MSVVFILGLILSALIGLSLGLIGGGGSILTVPILVYFLNVDAHDAVGMSLAVVGATSLLGAALHHRRGNLSLREGLIFGASGAAGAFAGAPLTHFLSPNALLLVFAGLMFIVAFSMFWRRANRDSEISYEPKTEKAIAAGFGVGVLTGFLGVGGGFLIVPALVLFGGLPMKRAIGTSLFVICLNCIAGLLAHTAQSHFNWPLTMLVISLAVAGTIAGTMLSRRLPAQSLKNTFAALVLVVAVFLFAKNYMVLF